MSLYITSLNSGSNGNCYYVGNDTEAILVDAGISCRETETRLLKLNLSMSKVKAIFVSHEHSDHIRGIPVLAKKYNLPVYISAGTLRNCRFSLDHQHYKIFTTDLPVTIGSMSIIGFSKLHDAAEPHSFLVECAGVKVGVFTDIGAPCKNLKRYFKQCNAAFLESNYDEEMLEKGSYPIHLKNRIRGGKGHLSNNEALNFFKEHRPSFLTHLILSHLSKENNCPTIVQKLFDWHANGTKVEVASRYCETPVFYICGQKTKSKTAAVEKVAKLKSMQLTLF